MTGHERLPLVGSLKRGGYVMQCSCGHESAHGLPSDALEAFAAHLLDPDPKGWFAHRDGERRGPYTTKKATLKAIGAASSVRTDGGYDALGWLVTTSLQDLRPASLLDGSTEAVPDEEQ